MLNKFKKSILFRILVIALVVGLSQVLYTGYLVATTPKVIRKPQMEHYHFRMQILVNGKAEDFSAEEYQTEYAKDQCSADITETPIHLHDNKDQFTHIHWEGITGGMVLKTYGWNYIGGASGALGYRIDKLTDIKKVNIHGNILPMLQKYTKFYVYIGDENGYKERSFNDWKNQDLEDFFGTKSNMPDNDENEQKNSFLNRVFPKAYAHGDEDHSKDKPNASKETESEEHKLTRINNLIGNVVIFAQKEAPTDQQIKDRFNMLVPLTESTCGG